MIKQFELIEAVQRFRAATDALAERVIIGDPYGATIAQHIALLDDLPQMAPQSEPMMSTDVVVPFSGPQAFSSASSGGIYIGAATERDDLDTFVDTQVEIVKKAAGGKRWSYLVWRGEPKAHLQGTLFYLTFRGAFGGDPL